MSAGRTERVGSSGPKTQYNKIVMEVLRNLVYHFVF